MTLDMDIYPTAGNGLRGYQGEVSSMRLQLTYNWNQWFGRLTSFTKYRSTS